MITAGKSMAAGVFVSWFPGCAERGCLQVLEDIGVAGIEVRYLDEDASHIAHSRMGLGFHIPTLPGDAAVPNLAEPVMLEPYREGRMRELNLCTVPWFSFHCGYSCESVQKRVGPDLALSPTLGRDETRRRMVGSVRELGRLTGRRILIENLDYGPTGALEHVCEPEFIRAVCEAGGCGVLFDIAHARVSAKPLGLTEEAYVGRMISELSPLVAEVHISSPLGETDAHLPATERELGWLTRLLEAGARPGIVVIERAWGADEGKALARSLHAEVLRIIAILQGRDGGG